ncbi:Putative ribonuclease H protein At1g65750 [Linum perenne]
MYWKDLDGGLQWSIRSGRQTKFWNERWLDSGILLKNHATDISAINNFEVVADFCSHDGVWDHDKLRSCLSEEAVRQVVGMPTPRDNLGEDYPVWGLETNGKFSIKSCYNMIKELQPDDDQTRTMWKLVWQWPGPNRIRHFLWLVSHNKVLTNLERRRRHISQSTICQCCNAEEESLIHLLHDCCKAREAWLCILPASSTAEFFSLDLGSWWKKYLADQAFNVSFGVMIWILWKQRNEFVFAGVTQAAGQAVQHHAFWVNLIKSSISDARHINNLGARPLRELRIAWEPAPDPWITLNADGSFKRNLGTCSITRADLSSAVECLELAWKKGHRKVSLQLDSKCVVQILNNLTDLDHQHFSLVTRFNDLIQRDWEVNVQHIFREANFLADYLANCGHLLPFGIHEVPSDDPCVSSWSDYDRAKSSRSRLVRDMM